MFALRSAALLLLTLLSAGLNRRPAQGSGSTPFAPGAAAKALDDGAWTWSKFGLRLLPGGEERAWRPRIGRWERPTVIAVRPNGLGDLAGVKPGAKAVLVPQGETAYIETINPKPMWQVVNSDGHVLRISTIGRPWVLPVTGLQPGVTHLTMTDTDGKEDKLVVIVERKLK